MYGTIVGRYLGKGDTQPVVKICMGLSLGDPISFDIQVSATRCSDGDTVRYEA